MDSIVSVFWRGVPCVARSRFPLSTQSYSVKKLDSVPVLRVEIIFTPTTHPAGHKSSHMLSVWPERDHKYFLNYLLNPCHCNWWKLQKLKNWKVASNPSLPTQLGKGDGWAQRNPELFHFAALIHNNGLWGNINLSLPLGEKAARYLFATLCHL